LKVINRDNIHFDRNYDGIISSSIKKICNCDIELEDMYYTDEWWNMDNYFDMVSKRK